MKRILIAGATSALIIGSVAFAQADQSAGAYGNQESAGAAGSMSEHPADHPADSTSGAGSADTTETTTETTTGAGADYAATGERG